jgi:hypothetical protein
MKTGIFWGLAIFVTENLNGHNHCFLLTEFFNKKTLRGFSQVRAKLGQQFSAKNSNRI